VLTDLKSGAILECPPGADSAQDGNKEDMDDKWKNGIFKLFLAFNFGRPVS
jgi:hypothetical protein